MPWILLLSLQEILHLARDICLGQETLVNLPGACREQLVITPGKLKGPIYFLPFATLTSPKEKEREHVRTILSSSSKHSPTHLRQALIPAATNTDRTNKEQFWTPYHLSFQLIRMISWFEQFHLHPFFSSITVWIPNPFSSSFLQFLRFYFIIDWATYLISIFNMKHLHSTQSHQQLFFNYKSKRLAEGELTEESVTKALFYI